MESTKPTLNEAENGNKSKPLLCEVAVLCNYPHLFKRYVFDYGKIDENYTFIRTKEMCNGKIFDKIVYTVDWHDMDNFQEVEKHVISRVKKNICDVCGCEKDKEKECDYCIRQYALSWSL